MAWDLITSLLTRELAPAAVSVTTYYEGDLDDAPLGWVSYNADLSSMDPDIGNGVVLTFANADTSPTVKYQLAIGPDTGRLAVRLWWVGNGDVWGPWFIHQPGYPAWADMEDTLADKVDTTDGRLSDARTPTAHNHDDRYYTETEVDGLLGGKSDTSHNHDSRYYTESEIDSALSGKQPLDSDLTTIAGLTATTDNFIQAKSSAWASRTPAQVVNDLPLPYDMWIKSVYEGTIRQVGGNDITVGYKFPRPVRITKVEYRCKTADASGNLSVELRKNGAQISGTNLTIAAANQVAGSSATGTWNFAAGDVLLPWITALGTTPGYGLDVYITAVTLPA